MIKVSSFYQLLIENGITFFTGVPDSLLKDFCAYVKDNTSSGKNIIAANEGNSIALAAGHYLATKQMGLVYMQNSGLGNAVNPLTSLTDPLVYSIPLLMLIGWRGEPGVKDEPQHVKQGEITLQILEVLGVEHKVLPDTMPEAEETLKVAVDYMCQKKAPYALIIQKNTFEPYSLKKEIKTSYSLNREQALKIIASKIGLDDIIVSTTGKTSRELFEYRTEKGEGNERDFLTVGSMGHSSQIALGIALAKPHRNVYCLDGDGAFIMHMGSLAINGDIAPANFKHIVLNNGAHDSVGGQPTVAFNLDIPAIAKACGYKTVLQAKTEEEILETINALRNSCGAALLEVKVNKGSRKGLGRPTTTPIENKEAFMKFLARG